MGDSYEDMTTENLEELNQDLSEEKETIRGKQREIAKVLDARAAEAATADTVLSPNGIASEEDVGAPGG